MTEPTAPSTAAGLALAAAMAAFGPLVGNLMIIAVGAFGGALVALMLNAPSSVRSGIAYLFSAMILALFVTGILVFVWADLFHLPAAEALAGLSFYIGLRRDWALGLLKSRVEGMDK